MTFDRMTRPEFAGDFVRVTVNLKIKGCANPQELDGRINSVKVDARNKAKEAERRGDEYNAKRYRRTVAQMGNLLKSDFSETAFRHAALYPKDMVNLSLLFGVKKAQEIKLARERARLRNGKSGAVSRYSDLHRRL